MPRNRYTAQARAEERRLFEIQLVQIERLSEALEAEGDNPPLIPPINPVKQVRSLRRAHARKHKPARYRNAGTQSF